MKNFVEELKSYFASTSKEELLAEWKLSEHLNEIGPGVLEFVENSLSSKYILKFDIKIKDPDSELIENENNLNPNFNSGFLILEL